MRAKAIMGEKKEKSVKIVKSIKVLEGVLKSSSDRDQRVRVKKEIGRLREMLREIYPDSNIYEIEDAIYSETMVHSTSDEPDSKKYELLSELPNEKYSPNKTDHELNLTANIIKHLEEKVWGIISDQHTKLDFSNSAYRDSLYRKLDGCIRALKLFIQTVEDLDKTKSAEYGNQLNLMLIKQGNVFKEEAFSFLAEAKGFIAKIVSDADFGGNIVLNPEEKIEYADYEEHKYFIGWTVLEALRYLKTFLNETAEVLELPESKDE